MSGNALALFATGIVASGEPRSLMEDLIGRRRALNGESIGL